MILLIETERDGDALMLACAVRIGLERRGVFAAVVDATSACAPGGGEGDAWREQIARRVLESAGEAHRKAGVRVLVVAMDRRAPLRPEEVVFWLGIGADPSRGAHLFRFPGRRSVESVEEAAGRIVAEPSAGEAVAAWSPDPPRIETGRLVLTWASREQISEMYRAIVGSSVFDQLNWDGPSSEVELHDWAAAAQRGYAKPRRERNIHLAVVDKGSGRQIGSVGYRHYAGATMPQGMIGYWIEEKSQGRGYGTEAVGAFVDFLFGEEGSERVEAEVFWGNERSRRLLERLGFVLEADMPRRARKRGRYLGEWIFGITRERWESRRGGG